MTGERTLPGGSQLKGFFTPNSDDWEGEAGVDGNWRKIGAGLAGNYVICKSQTVPLPGSPAIGDIYVIADGETNEKEVAVWDGPGGSEVWNRYPPFKGLRAYALDEDNKLIFDGTNWVADLGGGGGIENTLIVEKTTTQVISSGVNTLITFDGDVHDPMDAHDPVTNNSRLYGWMTGNHWYKIRPAYMTEVTTASLRWQHWVSKNAAGATAFDDTTFPRLQREASKSSASTGMNFSFEAEIQLLDTDYVEMLSWIGSGPCTLEAEKTFLAMEWLGPVV